MWVYADYLQANGEVKERNRFFKALNEIRKIAMLNYDQDIPLEMKEQFKLVVQQCDDALKSATSHSN